jgi:TorA-specific chaperone
MRLHDMDERRQEVLLHTVEMLQAVFWGPDAETCRELLDGALADLATRAGETPVSGLADALDVLAARGAGLARQPDPCLELESEYVRLFISSKGGVAASLYQSVHEEHGGRPRLMGPSAEAMRERLVKAGLTVDQTFNEPPDHLCIELAYLHLLLDSGWQGDAEALEQAVAFARDILPWCRSLSERVEQADNDFFAAAATVLLRLLEHLSS